MKRFVFLAVLLCTSAITVPVVAKKPESAGGGQDKASGAIDLTVHTHSSQFGGPGGAPLLLDPTTPLAFPISEQTFSYSSVSCEDPARFNDVALEFNPDYPGIEDPAKVRHIVEGAVTDVHRNGRIADVSGTLTTFLCEGPRLTEEGDEIHFSFTGRLIQKSDNVAEFRGRFTIEGGTGRFADMTGQGSMHGRLTCLPAILQREGVASCAKLGAFSDAVFFRGPTHNPDPEDITGGLKGQYEDPTVPAS